MPKTEESVLKFKNYVVTKQEFEINKQFAFNEKKTIQIDPKFDRKISKIDKDHAIIGLAISIENKNNDKPFSLRVEMEGLFELENWEKDGNTKLLKTNSIAIMFPFLRNAVSTLTTTGNIGPYILPVVNITAMFSD